MSIPITMAIFPTWRRLEFIVFGAVVALLVVARHKSNVGRLLAGTESKIGGARAKGTP